MVDGPKKSKHKHVVEARSCNTPLHGTHLKSYNSSMVGSIFDNGCGTVRIKINGLSEQSSLHNVG